MKRKKGQNLTKQKANIYCRSDYSKTIAEAILHTAFEKEATLSRTIAIEWSTALFHRPSQDRHFRF
jgi:hypothetical protein